MRRTKEEETRPVQLRRQREVIRDVMLSAGECATWLTLDELAKRRLVGLRDDLDAAVELATTADSDASDLGIDRELPLARCVLARALLARGDLDEAAGAVLRAIDAARSLTFAFPFATCLETAALVCLRRSGDAVIASQMLATAAEIRDRGNRPGPVTMAAAVSRAGLRSLPPALRSRAPGARRRCARAARWRAASWPAAAPAWDSRRSESARAPAA